MLCATPSCFSTVRGTLTAPGCAGVRTVSEEHPPAIAAAIPTITNLRMLHLSIPMTYVFCECVTSDRTRLRFLQTRRDTGRRACCRNRGACNRCAAHDRSKARDFQAPAERVYCGRNHLP